MAAASDDTGPPSPQILTVDDDGQDAIFASGLYDQGEGGAPAPSAAAVAAAAKDSSTSTPRDLVTRPAPEALEGDEDRGPTRQKITGKLSSEAQQFADAANNWGLTIAQASPNSDTYYCFNGGGDELYVLHKDDPSKMYRYIGGQSFPVYPGDKIRFESEDLTFTREAARLI